MILRVLHRPVTWTLLVAVLFMFGAATGGAVAHEIEHAHHTAALHGTGVCAWMCASAHTIVTAAVAPSAVTPVEAHPLPPDLRARSVRFPSRFPARAPPSLR